MEKLETEEAGQSWQYLEVSPTRCFEHHLSDKVPAEQG